MKKYLIGAVIGAVAVLGGYALAAQKGFSLSNTFPVGEGQVKKVYDADNNVVCYLYREDDFGSVYFASARAGSLAISCLKNL